LVCGPLTSPAHCGSTFLGAPPRGQTVARPHRSEDRDGALSGLWTALAFFSVLANLRAGSFLTVPLVAPQSAAGRFFAQTETAAGAAVDLALVCIFYNLLLRDLWNPHGLERIADTLMHDIVPPLVIAYAWWRARNEPVDLVQRLRWGIWPILYFAYALLRGAVTDAYPYPFIDIKALGVLPCSGTHRACSRFTQGWRGFC
jgi:hypothetical protein